MKAEELEMGVIGDSGNKRSILSNHSSRKSLISKLSRLSLSPEGMQKLPVSLEITVLTPAVVVLWAIFLIPTIIIFSAKQESSTTYTCGILPGINQSECAGVNASNNTLGVINGSIFIECSPDFYVDKTSGLCRPECGKWSQLSDHTQAWLHPLTITMLSLQIVGGALLLIASCINYKQMFRYPSIYIVFGEFLVTLLEMLFLIAYCDEYTFYCPTKDYLHALENPTWYCNIATGALVYFSLACASLFWLMHVTTIFMAIKFPFKMRDFEAKGYTKYAHITATIAAPIIAAILLAIQYAIGHGYSTHFLPIGCGISDLETVYFTFSLIMTVTLCTAGSFLIVTLWELMKAACFHYRTSGTKVWPKHITKAQIKVLLSLLWYMIYGLILLLALSTLAFVSKRVSDELTVYLYCESTGVSPGKECDRSGFEENEGVYLFAVQVVFGTGYHFINLMYALNIDKLRKLFSRHRWRGRNIK